MKPYACNGKPRPVAGEVTHLAQDGYNESRAAVWVPVLHVFTTACQYDQGSTDQRCAGCEHIKLTGE